MQKLVQHDTESLMVYCERGRESMRKMGVLRFADKDRRMVSALVRGLRHEIRGSVASKIAERPNQVFQEVVKFLRQHAILAGDATTGKLEHAMIGREKIGGQQKKKQKQGGKQKNPKIQCWRCGKIGHPKRLCPEGVSESAAVSREAMGVEFAFTAVRGVTLREHACVDMADGRGYRQGTWLVDSRASCHMCNDISMVSVFRRTVDEWVTLGDHSQIEGIRRGTVKMKVDLKNAEHEIPCVKCWFCRGCQQICSHQSRRRHNRKGSNA